MSNVKTVKQSFKAWMKENYEDDELEDIAKYGAQSGFHGMIYYHETSKLYDKYHQDIWTMINEDADDMGLSAIEMISSFNGGKDVYDDKTFKNLLVWYSAERVAAELTDG